MRPASEIITPHKDGLASGEDALVLGCIAYLVLHAKAGAANMVNQYPDLYRIRAYQWQHISARHFFNQYAIVTPARERLNTWVLRWV